LEGQVGRAKPCRTPRTPHCTRCARAHA